MNFDANVPSDEPDEEWLPPLVFQIEPERPTLEPGVSYGRLVVGDQSAPVKLVVDEDGEMRIEADDR